MSSEPAKLTVRLKETSSLADESRGAFAYHESGRCFCSTGPSLGIACSCQDHLLKISCAACFKTVVTLQVISWLVSYSCPCQARGCLHRPHS
eukprot:g27822.t1